MSEIIVILVLFIILLNPKDIEFLIKNVTNIIIKINKYVYQIKKDFLKL